VNVRGELVGINTAIFSTSGGYQGIGFAIPSSMAKTVMDNLINKGKVVRGWLGVSIQPVTPDLAKQFGIKDDKGALVGDVVEEGPAEKAGIQRGDVIIEFDGREVGDPSSLRNSVAGTPPGKKVKIGVMRDGKMQNVDVTIAELPADLQKLHGGFDNLLKGVMIQGLTPELKKNLDIPKRITGVIVADIDEDSPAAGLLMQNDVIIEVNRRRIGSTKDYETIVSRIKSGQDILLLVFRNGTTTYLSLAAR
jgi:serine protease Do